MNQFVDHVEIMAKAGDGGNGCLSFRREKFVPRGGPDGGNGGRGGHIIFRANENMTTLLDFKFRPLLKAKRGKHGQGSKKNGSQGTNMVLNIPIGTVIWELPDKKLIHDFTFHDEQFVIAQGGDGGRGNACFKSSRNQTPMRVEEGKPGEEKRLLLELKLFADVGIVGLPNAGKSTLINQISNCKSKVASYHFTTLNPMLGILRLDSYNEMVLADLPGIIEGAHENVGLGHQFLRHAERTKILVFVLDASAQEGVEPWVALKTLFDEMSLYDKTLLEKPRFILANKQDISESLNKTEILKSYFPDEIILPISAVMGTGVDLLVIELKKMYTNIINPKSNWEEV